MTTATTATNLLNAYLIRTALAASLALLATPVFAATDPLPLIRYVDEVGMTVYAPRCGVQPFTAGEVEAVRAALEPSPLERSGDCVGTAREIALAFHIVTDGNVGNVTDSQIANQIKVLNAAFAGSAFSFYVVDVERISNAAWFANCDGSAELAMKQALAYDPTELINIYTCKASSGTLGVATFPSDYPENDKRHGIILNSGTFPGGALRKYNLGDTAVHEMGHYFGLFHTFEGGCKGQGDLVGDTPAEATANLAAGCPATRNTCSKAGLDPVANFMDYSTDACMVNFSLGQLGLMHAMLSRYRPSLP